MYQVLAYRGRLCDRQSTQTERSLYLTVNVNTDVYPLSLALTRTANMHLSSKPERARQHRGWRKPFFLTYIRLSEPYRYSSVRTTAAATKKNASQHKHEAAADRISTEHSHLEQ